MKLTPLGDRVVLKQLAAEETTVGGIIIATQSKEKPNQAEVVAVGPGSKDVEMNVAVGQTVIFAKFAGTTVELDKEEYIIVKQDDILAIVE